MFVLLVEADDGARDARALLHAATLRDRGRGGAAPARVLGVLAAPERDDLVGDPAELGRARVAEVALEKAQALARGAPRRPSGAPARRSSAAGATRAGDSAARDRGRRARRPAGSRSRRARSPPASPADRARLVQAAEVVGEAIVSDRRAAPARARQSSSSAGPSTSARTAAAGGDAETAALECRDRLRHAKAGGPHQRRRLPHPMRARSERERHQEAQR
jgi:hypothetical protein